MFILCGAPGHIDRFANKAARFKIATPTRLAHGQSAS
jgi:hypothetical protein